MTRLSEPIRYDDKDFEKTILLWYNEEEMYLTESEDEYVEQEHDYDTDVSSENSDIETDK